MRPNLIWCFSQFIKTKQTFLNVRSRNTPPKLDVFISCHLLLATTSTGWKSARRRRRRRQPLQRCPQRAAWPDPRKLCRLDAETKRRRRASWTQWWSTCQARCRTCWRSSLASIMEYRAVASFKGLAWVRFQFDIFLPPTMTHKTKSEGGIEQVF